ncbi:MAG: CBS domain-containing protein, partial [Flavobacteriales bacterium]
MVAIEAISREIRPIHKGTSLEEVLRSMDSNRVDQLPVVEEGRFLGLIYHADVLAHQGIKETVADLENDLIKVYVNKDQHLYELVKVADEFDLTLIPVLEESEEEKENEWV